MSDYRSSCRVDVLMVLCYIFGRNRRSCNVFFALGRGVVELFPYNEQASRKLLPVGCIIPNQKRFLTLGDNEIRDIHYSLLGQSLLSAAVRLPALLCGRISE